MAFFTTKMRNVDLMVLKGRDRLFIMDNLFIRILRSDEISFLLNIALFKQPHGIGSNGGMGAASAESGMKIRTLMLNSIVL
jgi:hypothetical protein